MLASVLVVLTELVWVLAEPLAATAAMHAALAVAAAAVLVTSLH